MKKIFFLCSIMLIVIASDIFAQKNQFYLDSIYLDKSIYEIAEAVYDNGWLIFKPESKIDPLTIFEKYKSNFGLGKNDYMKLDKKWMDDYGFTHYSFQQYYKNIKVENVYYLVHSKDGIVVSANGKLVTNLKINIQPLLDNETSKNKFVSYIKNDKKITENIDLFSIPDGELIITLKSGERKMRKENYALSYKFKTTFKNETNKTVYIDSDNGKILKEKSENRNIYDVVRTHANVETIYYGVKDVDVVTYKVLWPWVTFYELAYDENADEPWVIQPVESKNETKCIYSDALGDWICQDITGEVIYDYDNTWTSLSERKGATVLWCAKEAYNYFKNEHGINGINDDYGEVNLYFDTDFSGTPNASIDLSNRKIMLGKAVNGICQPVMSIDVIAHEWAHGISHYIKNLTVYEGEKGALNESFSDIFGAIIQEYVEGFNHDRIYTYGEDYILTGSENNRYIRSFQYPKLYGEHHVVDFNCGNIQSGQPDTYEGDFWYPGSCDYGGVHSNNSVMNYWFYLLAEGGAGTNDYGFNYTVEGVGFGAAKEIFTYAYFNYIETNSEFIDARNATIRSAITVFGACSQEYIQVVKAWDAVGVYSNGPESYEDLNVSCDVVSVYHTLELQYTGIATDELKINCDLPNNKRTVLKSGNTISLLTGFSSGTGSETFFKAYIMPCEIYEKTIRSETKSEENNKMNILEYNETIQDSSLLDLMIEELNITDEIKIFPNPANGEFKILIKSDVNATAEIEIIDLVGRVVFNSKEQLYSGQNHIDINATEFDKGIFLINTKINNKTNVTKLIVK